MITPAEESHLTFFFTTSVFSFLVLVVEDASLVDDLGESFVVNLREESLLEDFREEFLVVDLREVLFVGESDVGSFVDDFEESLMEVLFKPFTFCFVLGSNDDLPLLLSLDLPPLIWHLPLLPSCSVGLSECVALTLASFFLEEPVSILDFLVKNLFGVRESSLLLQGVTDCSSRVMVLQSIRIWSAKGTGAPAMVGTSLSPVVKYIFLEPDSTWLLLNVCVSVVSDESSWGGTVSLSSTPAMQVFVKGSFDDCCCVGCAGLWWFGDTAAATINCLFSLYRSLGVITVGMVSLPGGTHGLDSGFCPHCVCTVGGWFIVSDDLLSLTWEHDTPSSDLKEEMGVKRPKWRWALWSISSFMMGVTLAIGLCGPGLTPADLNASTPNLLPCIGIPLCMLCWRGTCTSEDILGRFQDSASVDVLEYVRSSSDTMPSVLMSVLRSGRVFSTCCLTWSRTAREPGRDAPFSSRSSSTCKGCSCEPRLPVVIDAGWGIRRGGGSDAAWTSSYPRGGKFPLDGWGGVWNVRYEVSLIPPPPPVPLPPRKPPTNIDPDLDAISAFRECGLDQVDDGGTWLCVSVVVLMAIASPAAESPWWDCNGRSRRHSCSGGRL